MKILRKIEEYNNDWHITRLDFGFSNVGNKVGKIERQLQPVNTLRVGKDNFRALVSDILTNCQIIPVKKKER